MNLVTVREIYRSREAYLDKEASEDQKPLVL